MSNLLLIVASGFEVKVSMEPMNKMALKFWSTCWKEQVINMESSLNQVNWAGDWESLLSNQMQKTYFKCFLSSKENWFTLWCPTKCSGSDQMAWRCRNCHLPKFAPCSWHWVRFMVVRSQYMTFSCLQRSFILLYFPGCSCWLGQF